MSNLCLHRGAKIIDLQQLHDVETPDETPTWTPIPHYSFVNTVKTALTDAGANIVNEEHSLYNNGDRYFGLLHLNGEDGGNTVVGLRNCHDKTFSAGLSCGNRVFVCDNLSFSGDVVVARKHTRFIIRDLDRLIFAAVAKLADLRQAQATRFAAYQGRDLTNLEAHDLIIRALLAKIVSGEQVAKVVGEWREPAHEDFQPRTVWSLFNDFTEVLKGTAPQAAIKRTITLHGLLDAHCGLAL